MNIRSILILVVALVIAGGTAIYARAWLIGNRAVATVNVPAPEPKPETKVLVAASPLAAGQFVQPKDMKWQPWPEDGLNDEYVVKGKRSEKDFLGTVVRSQIVAGQPITDKRVVHPGDRGFLAAVLTPGLRAVSVPVNPTTGISGFVFPGDLVDVLLTVKFAAEDGEGKRHTRYFSETLLTGVRVLAIDQRTENADGEVKPVKTVTLEVSPKNAEHIAIGLELGSLTLSLHSLAREPKNADPNKPKLKLAEMVPTGGKRGSSFTLDGQIFHMLAPAGTRRDRNQVNVLRGNEAGKSSGGSRP